MTVVLVRGGGHRACVSDEVTARLDTAQLVGRLQPPIGHGERRSNRDVTRLADESLADVHWPRVIADLVADITSR